MTRCMLGRTYTIDNNNYVYSVSLMLGDSEKKKQNGENTTKLSAKFLSCMVIGSLIFID